MSLNAAPDGLKERLRRGESSLGLWITLESASITEIAAYLGLDWVVIDTEHGHLDFKEVLEHVRATRGSSTAPLVRIQETEEGVIKRVLDLGAQGILIPMVRTADDVRRAIRFAKYPPQGIRGISVERATRWGMELQSTTAKANGETLIIPIIENVDAAENFEAILEVPGVDALFFGPYDFAASMGHLGVWGHPDVWRRIESMRRRAQARGIPVGIVAPSVQEGRARIEEGFSLVAVGFDVVLLAQSVRERMEGLGRPIPEKKSQAHMISSDIMEVRKIE